MDIWGETKIDFLGKRRITFVISTVIILMGLWAILAIPMGKANLGTDFSGGVSVQFRFEKPVSMETVRPLLAENGFKDANLQQLAGNDKLLVRLKRTEGDLSAVSRSLGDVLAKGMPDNPFVVDSTTEVGPTVGKKLQQDALWRSFFPSWAYSYMSDGGSISVRSRRGSRDVHDVLAVMALLYILDKEMSLLIVTALLTVAGYSLTDTVVVFDRIRENMHKRTREELLPLINRSVNEVLRRTIVTSLTTLLATLALLLMGGEVIHDFALALFAGILVATYSSIFIASPILLFWKEKGRTSVVMAKS